MPSIKDLQNSQKETVIDATGGNGKAVINEGTETKETKGNNKTTVNLNGIFEQPKGRHKTVLPDSPSQKRVQGGRSQEPKDLVIDATSGGKRSKVDISSFPEMTSDEEKFKKDHFVDNPMDKMFDGEDSLLGKYLERKEEELKIEKEIVSRNIKQKELEEQAEETGDDSELIDFMNNNDDIEDKTVSVLDDDDILSSLNNEDEEDVEMGPDEDDVIGGNIGEPEGEIDYDDSELDDEQLYPQDIDEDVVDEEDEEEVINNLDDVSVEEEPDPEEVEKSIDEAVKSVKENKKKEAEVKIKNPDIDLEVTSVENTGNDIIDSIDTSLEIEEEEAPEEEDERDEVLKKLQQLATERLKPVSKKLDISSFTVVKKPISNTKQFNVNPVKAAKWVLMNQEATVMMREFTGAELERLREFTQDSSNSTSALTKRYRLIYDHIDSPKPASFETWLKTTPFSDEDNYFFAIYIASFKGANYIPRDCSDQNECKETWLTEDINIMDMVKFNSEEVKKKFTKIYQEENSSMTKAGLYISEIVPLSNTVAVAFKEPSIYTRIELSSIDSEFRLKYAAIMDYIPYIDSIYYIDQEEGTLTPVGYKAFADNNIKTTKSKIQQFAKVLSTLSIDEFGAIRPYVNSVITRDSGMSYIIPECTCPKCGKVVEEGPTTAEELLFTRYQLGALVSTSLN